MATFTAVGPALAIDGPLPVPPPHSLLSTEGVVVEGDGRWMNGVNVWGYPCDDPWLWEPCADGTDRNKPDESDMPVPRFDSLVVGQTITCSTISVGGGEKAREFAERASDVLRATASWGAERAISRGVTGSSNPHFGDLNLTVLGGGAVTAAVGLSYLENAIGGTGRGGMIHATPAVVSAWQSFFVSGVDEQRLITANGTPVVSGGGYIGVDPSGAASPGTGQDYVFATGPVRVYLGEQTLVAATIGESLDRSENLVTYRAERPLLPYWDTCLQVAVLIDYQP